mgnify:CR=1 FL=1
MSGLLGKGVLVNWGGVVAEYEADYNAWHSIEHMPERLAVPGFLRGRRGVAIAGSPNELKYFMMYEAVDTNVFVSAPYLERLNNPTPWTQRILSAYVAPSRTVCGVIASRGKGVGGYLATVQLSPADLARAREWAGGDWLDRIERLPGVLGVHALEGDPQLGQQPTVEKKFRESRGQPDKTVALALLVDGLDQDTTVAAMDALLQIVQAEIGCETVATVYRTQHVITRADLSL